MVRPFGLSRRMLALAVSVAGCAMFGTAGAAQADTFFCQASLISFYSPTTGQTTSGVGVSNPGNGSCVDDGNDQTATFPLFFPLSPLGLSFVQAGLGTTSTTLEDGSSVGQPILAGADAEFGIYKLVLLGLPVISIVNARSHVQWINCDGGGLTPPTTSSGGVQQIQIGGRTVSAPGDQRSTVQLGNGLALSTNVVTRNAIGITRDAVVLTQANADGVPVPVATFAESKAGGFCTPGG